MRLVFLLSLMIGTVTSVAAQSYADTIAKYREQKHHGFANNPTAPVQAEQIGFLDYFEPDETYRVTAAISYLLQEKPFRIPTSDGTSTAYVRYATLRFFIDGAEQELTAYRNTGLMQQMQYKDHLFVPFTDLTNGAETYEVGRYLDLSIADIVDNAIVVDFNKAYNPYCSYSSGYRCPIPPAENNLAVNIMAGEKKFRGQLGQRPKPVMAPKVLTPLELSLVHEGDTAAGLRILQVTDTADLVVLTQVSQDVSFEDPVLPLLARRMYLAMRDPSRPGVGIAGPQVGLNRNVIWVQRFDKEGEPFEFYLNPKITWRSNMLKRGKEGCLSIPDKREDILRSFAIKVSYLTEQGEEREETIEGFTAVIFQHETDHLYGVLFTDRLIEQAVKTYRPVNNIDDELLIEVRNTGK